MKKTASAPAKNPKAIKIKRFEERVLPCKHVFNATERLDLGNKLAAAMQTHSEVENQMKSIVADYKSKMKTIATEGDQFAARIRDGYEMREIKCIVHFNMATDEKGKPVKKQGVKRIVNAASKEFVRDEPMSPSDLQSEMFERDKLERESKEAKAKKKASETPAGDKPLNAPEIPEKGEKASTAATA